MKADLVNPKRQVSVEKRNHPRAMRAPARGKAPVEHLLVAWRDLPHALHGNATIAIEFDLKSPLLARRQRRDRLALHRLDERGFCVPHTACFPTRREPGKRREPEKLNRQSVWRLSAGLLALVPSVHFGRRGGGLQRCERFHDFVAVARASRHDPRVPRLQVYDLAFDM